MQRILTAILLVFITSGAHAALVTIDFSDPSAASLDGLEFGAFKQSGVGVIAAAVSSGPDSGVVLRTSALGLGASTPVCPGENPALFDGLCGTQGVLLQFDQDLKVTQINLSAFDFGLDIGVAIPFVDGVQGAVSSLGSPVTNVAIDLNAGDFVSTGVLNGLIILGAIPTTAFALHSIVVETVPEPGTLGLLLGGLGLLAFQLRRRSRG